MSVLILCSKWIDSPGRLTLCTKCVLRLALSLIQALLRLGLFVDYLCVPILDTLKSTFNLLQLLLFLRLPLLAYQLVFKSFVLISEPLLLLLLLIGNLLFVESEFSLHHLQIFNAFISLLLSLSHFSLLFHDLHLFLSNFLSQSCH